MSKQADASTVSTLAIIAGILGLIYNVHNYDRYYLAEPLSKKIIIINDKPEYVNGGKGGTSRYTFAGNDYQCRFWLSEGSLDAATKNDSIENAIKSIKIGDTIQIQIRTADNDFLQDNSKRIRVVGLTKQNNLLVDPEYVHKQDKKWRNINIEFAIFALVSGSIWKIIHYYKTKRVHDDNT